MVTVPKKDFIQWSIRVSVNYTLQMREAEIRGCQKHHSD
jgi:hypothetical protein